MNKLRRKVYMTAGFNTVSMGTGRKEFHPKKPRPGLEHYIREAGRGTLAQVGGAANIDEGVIGNFMAARFNSQGNLAAFIPSIDEGLLWKPCTRVEGACASGALALATGVKSVLAETAEMALAVGVEVQNTVKAMEATGRKIDKLDIAALSYEDRESFALSLGNLKQTIESKLAAMVQ